MERSQNTIILINIDPLHFILSLKNFAIDFVPECIIKKLKKIPTFTNKIIIGGP